MHTPWSDLEIFQSVAERGSFSRAARVLGLTQPTVSRRIAALEERLGRPLFRRDADGAHLTADGKLLLPAAEQMARWAREVDLEARNFGSDPEGVVRIATPPGLAHGLLVPFARDLRGSTPGIRIELLAGIEHIDLSRGDAEIALRSRPPTQPDLMPAFEFRCGTGFFASREYARALARRSGKPRPSDVDWITWSAPYEHLSPRPELEALIPDFRPVFASNDFVVQERAVALGLGAMVLSRTTDADSPHPAFVEIDLGIPLPPVQLFVVCAKSMRNVPRVSTVLDALASRLARVGGLEIVSAR
jgi:DNA-binding transcriptional LysR family regulator